MPPKRPKDQASGSASKKRITRKTAAKAPPAPPKPGNPRDIPCATCVRRLALRHDAEVCHDQLGKPRTRCSLAARSPLLFFANLFAFLGKGYRCFSCASSGHSCPGDIPASAVPAYRVLAAAAAALCANPADQTLVRTYQLARGPAERALVPARAKTAAPAVTPAPPAVAPSAPSAQAVPLALPAREPGVPADSAAPEQPLGVPLNTRRFHIHMVDPAHSLRMVSAFERIAYAFEASAGVPHPADNAIVLNEEPELPARPACAGSASPPPGPPAEDLEPVRDEDASPRAHYRRRRR
ncbi:hypothetical protein CSAL01_02213 [Colletotrichum salicis]|uniref:Uncharacterized protein n=1 Tax=Colletotrichum salicis TaxID=1209931 RepID=A0A135V792_9PEZI|nr:hypothetical protein CSAL01_02213 [Colletotrichum salicis]